MWQGIHTELKPYCASENTWDKVQEAAQIIAFVPFYKANDIVKGQKQPTNWEKIFTNPTSDRGFISKIYKVLKKVDSREPNNPLKMGNRAKQRIFT
ncbi:LINE-1 retrotransposable element ORF2 protein [Apodemus speciosus]|uniref:LINE-1 retrotransposable element ORF2 protein n=1 Tax=Apodemus speciosus TaxID=105296 RepID=A0ABQ0EWQ1_APOSI